MYCKFNSRFIVVDFSSLSLSLSLSLFPPPSYTHSMCMVLHPHSHGHDHGHSNKKKNRLLEEDRNERKDEMSGNGKKQRFWRRKKNHNKHGSEENINVRAAFIHVIGDLLQSIGVVIAGYIIRFKVRRRA